MHTPGQLLSTCFTSQLIYFDGEYADVPPKVVLPANTVVLALGWKQSTVSRINNQLIDLTLVLAQGVTGWIWDSGRALKEL